MFEKYKILESLHQKEEERAKEMDIKYGDLKTVYDSKKQTFEEASFKQMALQEELLGLSEKVILLEDVEMLNKENERLLEIN